MTTAYVWKESCSHEQELDSHSECCTWLKVFAIKGGAALTILKTCVWELNTMGKLTGFICCMGRNT